MRRAAVIDLSAPEWLTTAATAVGMAIAAVYWARSSYRKKVEEAISDATTKLEASTRSLLTVQNHELIELRAEVKSLRDQTSTLITLNQRYGAALAEKDLRIQELERDARVLEAQLLKCRESKH